MKYSLQVFFPFFKKEKKEVITNDFDINSQTTGKKRSFFFLPVTQNKKTDNQSLHEDKNR